MTKSGSKGISRRSLLWGAAGATAALPVATGIFPGPYIARASELKKINVGWTGSSICHNSLPSAFHEGFFQKHGLEPELLAFGGGNDAVLEALSSGKIDVTIGFILRLLKPLEQGANIRFTGSVHGGCIRVIAAEGTPEVDYASLKGKSIGVTSLASPSKNFLSVQLHKAGINPQSDVEWRVYPVDLFGEAIKKGEIQAAADADPGTFLLLRNNRGFLKEIGGQSTGIYAELSCCAVTVAKGFIEERPADAAAATYALTEAAQWVFENPDESSIVAAKYSPHPAPLLAEVIRSHRHDVNYTSNRRLRDEVAIYANDLREVGVIRRRTDPAELALRATVDIEA